eukprot:tig00021517_g22006.t1
MRPARSNRGVSRDKAVILQRLLPSIALQEIPCPGGEACSCDGSPSTPHARPLPLMLPKYGATLFADVSGFSKLSNALDGFVEGRPHAHGAPAGRRDSAALEESSSGVEVLTSILNALLDKLTTTVSDFGGDVIKFAGDACMAIFVPPGAAGANVAGEDEEPPAAALEAAVVAAVECAAAFGRIVDGTSAGFHALRLDLKVKVGIGAGPFSSVHLGVRARREFFVTGPAVQQALDAEHHAAPGEIVLSPDALALLPPSIAAPVPAAAPESPAQGGGGPGASPGGPGLRPSPAGGGGAGHAAAPGPRGPPPRRAEAADSAALSPAASASASAGGGFRAVQIAPQAAHRGPRCRSASIPVLPPSPRAPPSPKRGAERTDSGDWTLPLSTALEPAASGASTLPSVPSSGSLASLAPPGSLADAAEAGPAGPGPAPPGPTIAIQEPALLEALRAYVPLPVLKKLEGGPSAFVAELRRVSVLFVMLQPRHEAAGAARGASPSSRPSSGPPSLRTSYVSEPEEESPGPGGARTLLGSGSSASSSARTLALASPARREPDLRRLSLKLPATRRGSRDASPAPAEPWDRLGALNRIVAAAQAAMEQYEGSIRQVMHDDKGMVVICAFGLPFQSHEDDGARAVSAAGYIVREVAAATGRAWRPHIGIATGTAYSGFVGSRARSEYMLVGDSIVVAARLMGLAAQVSYLSARPPARARFQFPASVRIPRQVSNAPSQRGEAVLIDAVTREAVAGRQQLFHVAETEAALLKGKERAARVFRVTQAEAPTLLARRRPDPAAASAAGGGGGGGDSSPLAVALPSPGHDAATPGTTPAPSPAAAAQPIAALMSSQSAQTVAAMLVARAASRRLALAGPVPTLEPPPHARGPLRSPSLRRPSNAGLAPAASVPVRRPPRDGSPSPSSGLPAIEMDGCLAAFRRLLERLQAERASALFEVEAGAGLGKSTLVAALRRACAAAGVPCLVGVADSIERLARRRMPSLFSAPRRRASGRDRPLRSFAPYAPLRGVLGALVGAGAHPSEARARIEAALMEYGSEDLMALRPLLNALLPVHFRLSKAVRKWAPSAISMKRRLRIALGHLFAPSAPFPALSDPPSPPAPPLMRAGPRIRSAMDQRSQSEGLRALVAALLATLEPRAGAARRKAALSASSVAVLAPGAAAAAAPNSSAASAAAAAASAAPVPGRGRRLSRGSVRAFFWSGGARGTGPEDSETHSGGNDSPWEPALLPVRSVPVPAPAGPEGLPAAPSAPTRLAAMHASLAVSMGRRSPERSPRLTPRDGEGSEGGAALPVPSLSPLFSSAPAVPPHDPPAVALSASMRAGRREGHGAAGPIVIVIDDAQWADSASWALLASLEYARRPILLVLAYRPFATGAPAPRLPSSTQHHEGEAGAPGALPSDLLRLRAHGALGHERRELGPLGEADMEELLKELCDVDEVPRALVRYVQEASHGNPLWATEVLHQLAHEELVALDESVLPPAGSFPLTPDPEALGRGGGGGESPAGRAAGGLAASGGAAAAGPRRGSGGPCARGPGAPGGGLRRLTLADGFAERLLRRAVVPQKLNALIVARMDALAPPEQLMLKVASVLGRTFTRRTLLGIYAAVLQCPPLPFSPKISSGVYAAVLQRDDDDEEEEEEEEDEQKAEAEEGSDGRKERRRRRRRRRKLSGASAGLRGEGGEGSGGESAASSASSAGRAASAIAGRAPGIRPRPFSHGRRRSASGGGGGGGGGPGALRRRGRRPSASSTRSSASGSAGSVAPFLPEADVRALGEEMLRTLEAEDFILPAAPAPDAPSEGEEEAGAGGGAAEGDAEASIDGGGGDAADGEGGEGGEEGAPARGARARARAPPELLQFKHALVVEACYSCMVLRQKQRLHAVAGEWLEADIARRARAAQRRRGSSRKPSSALSASSSSAPSAASFFAARRPSSNSSMTAIPGAGAGAAGAGAGAAGAGSGLYFGDGETTAAAAASVLAHHFSKAGPAHRPRAAFYLERAGEAALQQQALPDALALYRRLVSMCAAEGAPSKGEGVWYRAGELARAGVAVERLGLWCRVVAELELESSRHVAAESAAARALACLEGGAPEADAHSLPRRAGAREHRRRAAPRLAPRPPRGGGGSSSRAGGQRALRRRRAPLAPLLPKPPSHPPDPPAAERALARAASGRRLSNAASFRPAAASLPVYSEAAARGRTAVDVPLECVRALLVLSEVYWHRAEGLPLAYANLRALNLAEAYAAARPDSSFWGNELPKVYASMGYGHHARGWHGAAAHYVERALECAQYASEPLVRADLLSRIGGLLLLEPEPELGRALAMAREASLALEMQALVSCAPSPAAAAGVASSSRVAARAAAVLTLQGKLREVGAVAEEYLSGAGLGPGDEEAAAAAALGPRTESADALIVLAAHAHALRMRGLVAPARRACDLALQARPPWPARPTLP